MIDFLLPFWNSLFKYYFKRWFWKIIRQKRYLSVVKKLLLNMMRDFHDNRKNYIYTLDFILNTSINERFVSNEIFNLEQIRIKP